MTDYVLSTDPRLCTKCKHVMRNDTGGSSPFYGARNAFCDDLRRDEALCGSAGKYFEAEAGGRMHLNDEGAPIND